jgi:hypothetical protein
MIVYTNAGTNSVNIIPDGDCEYGNTTFWGWKSTDSSINKSPTKSLTEGITTYYKVSYTKLAPIDGTKNYDLSNWVASSNYFKSNGTSLPFGIVLRTYEHEDDTSSLSSTTYFTDGGYMGFTEAGDYEGMVFQEVEDIDIPDNANYFKFRIQTDNASTGRIWVDNFYLGEVKIPGTILIIK